MNDLPLYLLDDILFRLEPKSLAIMRCTNKYFQSYISEDSDFQIGYLSLFRPSLFNLGSYGATSVCCHRLVSSLEKTANLNFSNRCYIFGSCSGLLLIYINGLFVANPFTNTFRLLDHSGSSLLPWIVGGDGSYYFPNEHEYPQGNNARTERAMCVGFAVNRTTKSFKIVCILEMETVYGFEINDGYCWRLSETTINASSKSDLTTRMKPLYLDGTLYWLRNDGSIIAFNPETEQAQFIPSIFYRESDMKLLFAADDNINRLTLLLGTKETISIYALRKNSKWILATQIKNVSMEDNIFVRWNMVAYDGKHLVVREMKDRSKGEVRLHDMEFMMKENDFKGLVHVYDMEANSWRVLGSTWCPSHYDRDFYKFTPSLFPVEEDEQTKVIVASDDQRIRYLSAVMRLIDTTK
ncbi:unnamed protein product [Arabidopsis arenosa]|uniref:F-box domain-containing protein n=1 Tax=Arabidopsis arenosa TaxID=38785 RepID=A0A8S1ZEB6_ARAAE|nr:unnamed protein product [Arabidopsis arenosa]